MSQLNVGTHQAIVILLKVRGRFGLLKLTFRASIVCGSCASALSTALISENVMNPKPLLLLETGSFITTASWTNP